MIVFANATLVLPDRLLDRASLLVDGGRIVAIDAQAHPDPAGAETVDASGHYIAPGLVDVHVHGVEGFDTLDAGSPVAAIAARLPRYGVTAFCPTIVACAPGELHRVLVEVARLRRAPVPGSARVLPAHLESNFINPDYRGAQPASCLRLPGGDAGRTAGGEFSADDVLEVIRRAGEHAGIITLAPELPGGLDLVRTLVAAGHRVSLGHSGASFDEAAAAIDAGARHATHLFNRMPPLAHRAPGLAGAVLAREEIAAELICDAHHVHPAMCRMAIAAKGTVRMMAITDGTGGSGLPPGATARLGGRQIRVTATAAELDDGTLAGSTLTMDRALRTLVERVGCTLVDAARMCATTPARELGLDAGAIVEGAAADLVVLDRQLRVAATYVGGVRVFAASGAGQRAGATA